MKLSITWFGSLPRGHRAIKDTTMRITFTKKPRGIRLNAALTRRLAEIQIEYVKMGFDDDRNVFMIVESNEKDGLKVVKQSSGNSAQVSASLAYIWALEKHLIGTNADGVFNEETKMFEFEIVNVPTENLE